MFMVLREEQEMNGLLQIRNHKYILQMYMNNLLVLKILLHLGQEITVLC